MYGSLPNINVVAEFMKAVTGWDITTEELIRSGERINNIRHAFNIREGLNPVQIKAPDRVLGIPPQKEGPLAGITVDADTMNKEYLTAADWDPKTGKPSKKKLLDLDMEEVARVLWP
jgi:aldehyde:ferredoxin oxidoreductase